ncbi:unnamed protein product [Paramecium sonneborni]|uniref:Uncharacterized protein n=1 Tax=Paramecium sonneborni TaxID=65129 RepID=A0A8S1R826_9CILI|nr:unnamed protein product [Paramecium sonneborni]
MIIRFPIHPFIQCNFFLFIFFTNHKRFQKGFFYFDFIISFFFEGSAIINKYNQSRTFFTGCLQHLIVKRYQHNGCINAKQCIEYLTQDICENSGNSSDKYKQINKGLVIVNVVQKCRDELCSEAGTRLTTDQECSKFRFGCISKGQGCTESPLKECNTYESQGQECNKLIGSDGACELQQGSQYCQQKKCETASNTYKSDEQCDQYLKGCDSTGSINVLQLNFQVLHSFKLEIDVQIIFNSQDQQLKLCTSKQWHPHIYIFVQIFYIQFNLQQLYKHAPCIQIQIKSTFLQQRTNMSGVQSQSLVKPSKWHPHRDLTVLYLIIKD